MTKFLMMGTVHYYANTCDKRTNAKQLTDTIKWYRATGTVLLWRDISIDGADAWRVSDDNTRIVPARRYSWTESVADWTPRWRTAEQVQRKICRSVSPPQEHGERRNYTNTHNKRSGSTPEKHDAMKTTKERDMTAWHEGKRLTV